MSGLVPDAVVDLARSARRVLVLTGAGASAESGVPTFRDAATGLWARFDPMELATPEAWAADPAQCWAWYAWRAHLVRGAEPNAGHRAIAAWQQHEGVDLRVSTQNVDGLHERSGAEVLAHVHGDLFALRCARCGAASDAEYPPVPEPVERLEPPVCGRCGGLVRPGVVWFGEMLPAGALEATVTAAEWAEMVVVVGTSGMVYPAAAVPGIAREAGVPVVEVNPAGSSLPDGADHVIEAPAGQALPALVAAL
ncbi:NAD-dependent deacylase [Kytococcus sedentarius]|uniref:NAD-dependent protein deacylase n=1 Tax=Kytococcus sedentarius (strain ATCC 14392 / DSM 20547 / JCM 11482 / CCUG 33030 / NBRC 15357 / NCTC 11040 / CCM 314 / 541) TaxID=478801 RepID=C7NLA3_KYTSD|nr:NAD-dependent deacylase [Kytococcus sedentarius]ACV05645.1 NAD-dependent protein deacetylase, SIR2 family [Kytococcus sedentarius DSM 20547]QQB64069.1 NAD-dependent deacylase [Kytococcus sedentarius]STX12939.1 NAD-dependent deacetylase [Kytococcus sedentarius]